MKSRLRMYVLVALIAVTSGGSCVSLDAVWAYWPGACDYYEAPFWRWLFDCPDVPSGGGGSGGW